MSYYLPISLGTKIELTDECIINNLRVYDTLMGLSSNFTNMATNIIGTDLNISGNANIGGFVTCNRVSVSSLTPSSGSHLTSKSYVDGLITTASTNLTKTGNNIAMNSSISLTGVTLTGALVGTTGTFSGVVSCANPTLSGHATTKSYVDGLASTTASGNLTKTGNDFTLNPSISLTGITLSGAFSGVTGVFSSTLSAASFSGNVIGGTVSGTTGIFSSTLSATSFTGNVIGGTISGTTGIFSSTLSATSFSGNVIGGTVSGTTGTFTGITTITNTTASSSTTTGALVVSGGIGASGDVNVTGFVAANRVSVGNLVPSSASHLTSKNYVDGLVVTASGNLTKSGVNITLNPSISLTDVTASGNVTCATVPSSAGHLCNKTYVDGAITSTFVNGFLFFVTTTHNGVTLTYVTQKSYWHKIGLNLVCVQLCLQGITSASPSGADSVYTLTLPGGMPVISNIINGQKPSLDVRIVGDTLPNNYSWIAIPSISPQKITISQVDRSGALQNFPIIAGSRDIYLTLMYQCD